MFFLTYITTIYYVSTCESCLCPSVCLLSDRPIIESPSLLESSSVEAKASTKAAVRCSARCSSELGRSCCISQGKRRVRKGNSIILPSLMGTKSHLYSKAKLLIWNRKIGLIYHLEIISDVECRSLDVQWWNSKHQKHEYGCQHRPAFLLSQILLKHRSNNLTPIKVIYCHVQNVLSYTTTSNISFLEHLILTEACELPLLPTVSISSGTSQFPHHPTVLKKKKKKSLQLCSCTFFALFFILMCFSCHKRNRKQLRLSGIDVILRAISQKYISP